MAEIQRQPITSHTGNTPNQLSPADYLPDMAKAKLAQGVIEQLSPIAIVSKKFIVYQGMWLSLNHTPPTVGSDGSVVDPGRQTGLSTRHRNALYAHVESRSGNINGESFYWIFKYLISANIVVNQNAGYGENSFDTQEPGFFRRVINRVFGGGNADQTNGGSK